MTLKTNKYRLKSHHKQALKSRKESFLYKKNLNKVVILEEAFALQLNIISCPDK